MAGGDLFPKESEFRAGMADFIRRCLGGIAGDPAPRRVRPTGTDRLQQELLGKSARSGRRAR